MTNADLRIWTRINFLYLVVVALFAVLMRGTMAGWFTLSNYTHILHAHSHVAFTGWAYQTLFILLVFYRVPPKARRRGRYGLQMILTQLTVLGMLIAFALQGYGLYSITLSSIFQFLTYWFTWRFRKDYHPRGGYAARFMQIGLAALVISSFGPWGLAVLSARGLAGSDWYQMAIYFYLHFQYNGWFLFALAGLVLEMLSRRGVTFTNRAARIFLYLQAGALVPAYFLSLPGLVQSTPVYLAAALAALMQAGALFCLPFMINGRDKVQLSVPLRVFLSLTVTAFVLKTVLQALSLLPALQEIAFYSRPVIIAYIHLVVLGCITPGLWAVLADSGLMRFTSYRRLTGAAVFIAGFVLTELLLIMPVWGIWGSLAVPGTFWMAILQLAGLLIILP